jgi:hypothetical protein
MVDQRQNASGTTAGAFSWTQSWTQTDQNQTEQGETRREAKARFSNEIKQGGMNQHASRRIPKP